jgi:hypothetical protein
MSKKSNQIYKWTTWFIKILYTESLSEVNPLGWVGLEGCEIPFFIKCYESYHMGYFLYNFFFLSVAIQLLLFKFSEVQAQFFYIIIILLRKIDI